MVHLAYSAAPEGHAAWTLQLLANTLIELKLVDSISPTQVGVWLKKNTLKPWQVKSWCIPKTSANFVAKREDVLEVYARPYAPKRPVVCVDEASKELHSTPHGTLPAQPSL